MEEEWASSGRGVGNSGRGMGKQWKRSRETVEEQNGGSDGGKRRGGKGWEEIFCPVIY